MNPDPHFSVNGTVSPSPPFVNPPYLEDIFPPSPSETSLDSLTENNSTSPFCNQGGLLFKQANSHGYAAAVQLPCKSWNCPICGPKKGKQVWKRLKDAPVVLDRMITLPFAIGQHHGRTWEEAIAESGKTLNSFLTSMRRACSGLKYFWVREIGKKSKMVHFHVLIDRYVPQSVISRLWERAGGGSVVDIRKGKPDYLFKYMVKFEPMPQEVQNCLKGKRRWSCSRHLLLPLVRAFGRFSGWTWVAKGRIVAMESCGFMTYLGEADALLSFRCPMLAAKECFT